MLHLFYDMYSLIQHYASRGFIHFRELPAYLVSVVLVVTFAIVSFDYNIS
jgi:hypothetical protein